MSAPVCVQLKNKIKTSSLNIILQSAHCRACCFTFKKEDDEAHAKLHPVQDQKLDDFTIDFFYTMSEETDNPFFLSYATSKNDNEMNFGPKMGYITKNLYSSNKAYSVNTTERFTITRLNSQISVYINEHRISAEKSMQSIKAGGVWILGQEQDSLGGGFEGQITHLPRRA